MSREKTESPRHGGRPPLLSKKSRRPGLLLCGGYFMWVEIPPPEINGQTIHLYRCGYCRHFPCMLRQSVVHALYSDKTASICPRHPRFSRSPGGPPASAAPPAHQSRTSLYTPHRLFSQTPSGHPGPHTHPHSNYRCAGALWAIFPPDGAAGGERENRCQKDNILKHFMAD